MQHADVANLFLDRFLNPTTELNAIAGAVSALRQTAAHYDSFYFSYARGYSVISAKVAAMARSFS